ncbi:hypothetical protein LXL04_021175 [Taraxacum kok-saghyz]
METNTALFLLQIINLIKPKEQSRLHLSISPVSDFSPGLGLLLSIGDSKASTPLPASHWPLVHWSHFISNTFRLRRSHHFIFRYFKISFSMFDVLKNNRGSIYPSLLFPTFLLVSVSFSLSATPRLQLRCRPNIGGYCLMGKIPLDFLHLSWEKSPNLSLGERVEVMSTVSMQSCFMKSILQQVPMMISAEELGAKDISPYDVYSYKNIPRNSMSHVIRLRTGNVVFNYKYYNNILQRSEVTEDYSCPFCLVKCASYKVNEDYQVVIVSVKSDTGTSEIFGNIADPRQQSLFFCRKPLSRKEPEDPTLKTNHVLPSVLDSDVPATLANLRGDSEPMEIDIYSPNAKDVTGPESPQTLPGTKLLQFAKTRKLSVERSNPRNHALLQKRKFFHSHRAQVTHTKVFLLMDWGWRFMRLYPQYTTWENSKDPERPLVTGYVSPDYFTHSVSYFIEAPLIYHDYGKFKVVVYLAVVKADAKTIKFRDRVLKRGGLWRDIYGIDEKKVASLVREDKVDILVELTGHTANNKLGMMACRPAPLQVTWMGYPNTTGLPTIDYRITDSLADPIDTKQKYVFFIFPLFN